MGGEMTVKVLCYPFLSFMGKGARRTDRGGGVYSGLSLLLYYSLIPKQLFQKQIILEKKPYIPERIHLYRIIKIKR